MEWQSGFATIFAAGIARRPDFGDFVGTETNASLGYLACNMAHRVNKSTLLGKVSPLLT